MCPTRWVLRANSSACWHRGGRAILTFPFFPDRDSTVTRSAIGADGTVQHLLPAQYHGNPLGGGSLVVSELAWDFIAALQGIAGCQAEFLGYWSLYRRHFGANRFVLLLTRDGAAPLEAQT